MKVKQFLAMILSLAMTLSVFTVVSADPGSYEYGTPKVYDIYDLTGSVTNTILGTDATWEGQIKADISSADKENMAFRTKLTMETQEVRLALNAPEGENIYDATNSYAIRLNGSEGAVQIRRKNHGLAAVNGIDTSGTHVFEAGIVDILSGGSVVGKRIYVKMDDAEVCSYDDTDGYLTGDALGTKIIDFHYGASIQMDTTYTTEYGTPKVYDIYDLTGSGTNTILGTDSTWDGQIKADISSADKENMAFRTKLTMGTQEVRLALNAPENENIFDATNSYAIRLNGSEGAVQIRRQNHGLTAVNGIDTSGTHVFEAGIVDILFGGSRIGKRIYVKMDDTVVCSYDDTDGYLTGNALGTKIIDFHYGASIQMDTTYTTEYGTPKVYDIYDLTGSETNTILGTDSTWDGQIKADISSADKENMAFRTKLTMGTQEVRLALNAPENENIFDAPNSYAIRLNGSEGAVQIRRQNHGLTAVNGIDTSGTHVFEAGIVDILFGGSRIGKRIYVKMDDTVVCSYDDMDGYLTGDALGTKVIDFHYGSSIQMDTTYACSYGVSLALSDSLDILFTVDGLVGDPSAYSVTYAFNGKEATENCTTAGPNVFTVASCTAAEMTDEVDITVKKNGVETFSVSYSVMEYCTTQIEAEESGSKLSELCKAVLNYGASAQKYFDYNTDKLANAGYEYTDLPDVPDEYNKLQITGSGFASAASLSVKSRITINFRVSNVEGMTYSVSKGGSAVAAESRLLSDGRLNVSVTGIGPLSLDDVYTLTVSDGTNTMSIDYSALTYASRKQAKESTSEICRTLYNYYLKAADYVN